MPGYARRRGSQPSVEPATHLDPIDIGRVCYRSFCLLPRLRAGSARTQARQIKKIIP